MCAKYQGKRAVERQSTENTKGFNAVSMEWTLVTLYPVGGEGATQ